jgi:FkbM family methyltransferase
MRADQNWNIREMSDEKLLKYIKADAQSALDGTAGEDRALHADVLFAYRLLLGRQPEFEGFDLYDARRSTCGLQDFVGGFVASPEFRQRWKSAGALVPPCTNRLMVERSDGLRFWFHPKDLSIGWQVAAENYEPDVQRALASHVVPGAVCLDVGANLGFFSVLMAQAGAGKVYAFEPFPLAYELLRRNIAENRFAERIVPLSIAAAERNGAASICFAPGVNNSNHGGMFVPASDNSAIARAHSEVAVETARLDDLVPDDAPVSLVKMDIEGSELRALRGMQRILARDRPVIVLEFNTYTLRNMGEVNPQDLLDALETWDYAATPADAGRGQYRWRPEDGDVNVNLVCTPRNGAKSD